MALWKAGASILGGYMAGEGATDAAGAAIDAAKSAAALIAEQANAARNIIFKITPIAESNLLAGQQAGLNVLGESIGPQADLARGGNVAAQETLLAALPQMQSAIMGQGVDLSKIQSYQGAGVPDVNYQLPEFQSAISADVERMLETDPTAYWRDVITQSDAYKNIFSASGLGGGI